MALARPVRAALALAFIVGAFLILQTLWSATPKVKPPPTPNAPIRKGADGVDPNWEPTGEPPGPLVRADDYAADNPNAPRTNATLLALVRNEELEGMLQSMEDLERTWNSKFNYPWTFFNDVEFSSEFKRKTQEKTKAKCNYEVIPKEHWEVPPWISKPLFDESAKILKEENIQYADMTSYHQMCRWNSGLFYKHPALANVRWYWRVEPKVHFFCDVDYDVFRWMEDHNKTYGFTINLFDAPQSLPSLWPETEKFMAGHPEYLHKNRVEEWLRDDQRRPQHNRLAHGYSTCHFWSNFEIGDMNFWRGQAYEDYFNHLDRAGGFFYERWGDAPVHSIALALFEDKSKIHWFRDIGYQHIPFFNCPNSPKCKGCATGTLTDGEDWLYLEDCRWNWWKFAGKEPFGS